MYRAISILSDLYIRELDLGRADEILEATTLLKTVQEGLIEERTVRVNRMMKESFKKAVEHLERTNDGIKSPT